MNKNELISYLRRFCISSVYESNSNVSDMNGSVLYGCANDQKNKEVVDSILNLDKDIYSDLSKDFNLNSIHHSQLFVVFGEDALSMSFTISIDNRSVILKVNVFIADKKEIRIEIIKENETIKRIIL